MALLDKNTDNITFTSDVTKYKSNDWRYMFFGLHMFSEKYVFSELLLLGAKTVPPYVYVLGGTPLPFQGLIAISVIISGVHDWRT